MAEIDPFQTQNKAANIFADMVMDEAIKDKTIQMKQQYKTEEGDLVDPNQVEDHIIKKQLEQEQPDDDEYDEEEEKIMRELREKRLGEYKNENMEIQENMAKGHGQYTEIKEDEFLSNVTGSKLVICHFYHKDFERCKIVDHHLRQIAREHPEARFIYINAEFSPFFVAKLQIQVLPTIVCFADGIAVDRVVGFGDLGNKDDFPTIALTRRLIRSGTLKAVTKAEKGQINIKKGGHRKNHDDDDGSDSD